MLSGGSRELKARPLSSWVVKLGHLLDRAAFRPATLPDDLVTGIALLPPIAAGLIIFRLPALEMLGVAVAAGTVGVIVARWMWRHQGRHPGAGTLIAALFGVALVGAGASLATSIEIAVLAVVLELLHARYMPVIRAQAGLLAFAAVALITRGAPLAYFDPNGTTNPRDPIDTWYQLFHQSAWTLDPIRLYVGNVAGPTFATSLLAVAIGVAWLAYARRVSLVVLVDLRLPVGHRVPARQRTDLVCGRPAPCRPETAPGLVGAPAHARVCGGAVRHRPAPQRVRNRSGFPHRGHDPGRDGCGCDHLLGGVRHLRSLEANTTVASARGKPSRRQDDLARWLRAVSLSPIARASAAAQCLTSGMTFGASF